MTDPPPIACSLTVDELPARLAEIEAVGRAALRDVTWDGPRARLRFELAPGIRERLAAIVAAEARCCAFLTLALAEDAGAIVLTIEAPVEAGCVVRELVSAFERGGPASAAAGSSSSASHA